MSEEGVEKRGGVWQRIGRVLLPHKKETKGPVVRTSEIRSLDGLMSVGDSMRKMDVVEGAEEEGRLVRDGDAPQFNKRRR